MDFISIQPPQKTRFELILESIGRYLKKFSLFKNFAKRIGSKYINKNTVEQQNPESFNKNGNPIPSTFSDITERVHVQYEQTDLETHEMSDGQAFAQASIATIPSVSIKLEEITVKEEPGRVSITVSEPSEISSCILPAPCILITEQATVTKNEIKEPKKRKVRKAVSPSKTTKKTSKKTVKKPSSRTKKKADIV